MSSQDAFDDARQRVVAAIVDESVTVGASIKWGSPPFFVATNLAITDPALAPLFIDDLGRFWKERHYSGESSLVCVFDLRRFGPDGYNMIPLA